MTSFAFNNTRREEFLATVLANRKASHEQPNYRLIVKAQGENDAYVYTQAHGITPGRIKRLGDFAEFAVDVHTEDDRVLLRWFDEQSSGDGTLLMFSILNRDSDGNLIAA